MENPLKCAAPDLGARILAEMHLHAVLPRLVDLVRLSPEAAGIAKDMDLPLEFHVLHGPGTCLHIRKGNVTVGAPNGRLGLLFPTVGHLNRMFAGEKITPIPFRGLHHLLQVKKFEKLTELLTTYLKPAPDKLQDPVFRAAHVELSLMVGLAATDVIARLDPVVAKILPALHDGSILYRIPEGPQAWVEVKNHRFCVHPGTVPDPTVIMEIRTLDLAVDLIAGRVDTFAAVALTDVRIFGHASYAEEFNMLFDRVGLYLK